MIVRAYVKRQMTAELSKLATELQSAGGNLIVDVERTFREPKPCDAYISESKAIAAAYRKQDVPAFDSAMLRPEPDVLLEPEEPATRRVTVRD